MHQGFSEAMAHSRKMGMEKILEDLIIQTILTENLRGNNNQLLYCCREVTFNKNDVLPAATCAFALICCITPYDAPLSKF